MIKLFKRHPFVTKRPANSSDVSFGSKYPIGLSLDNCLDLFCNVKSFRYNITTQFINSAGFNSVPDSILAGLAALDAVNSSDVISSSGLSKRTIKPVGTLNGDGSEPSLSNTPYCETEYPYFTMGGGGALIIIDFGKTLIYDGFYFPEITIETSNGLSSYGVGQFAGSVSFGNFGLIPIFSNEFSLNIPFSEGGISIEERFDGIIPSSQLVNIEETIFFTKLSGFKIDFTHIIRAYFGHAKTEVIFNGDSMSCIVPQNAKSGPIRFESDEPQFDAFTSAFEVTIRR